jgi:hypothetical protein
MHCNHWLGFQRTALSAAVAIVAAAPAMAQNTTAAIGGRVVTADGKPVAGATVTILHRESGSANTLVTDGEGRYNARGLRVGGPYSVTAVKGADKNSQDDIYLQLAESLNFDIRLGGQTLEAVVITGSATANSKFAASSGGAGTNIGRQELETQASINRNLQDYARPTRAWRRPTRTAAKCRSPARTRATTRSPSTASHQRHLRPGSQRQPDRAPADLDRSDPVGAGQRRQLRRHPAGLHRRQRQRRHQVGHQRVQGRRLLRLPRRPPGRQALQPTTGDHRLRRLQGNTKGLWAAARSSRTSCSSSPCL